MYPVAKKEIMAFERKQVEMETIMLNKRQTPRGSYHKKYRERLLSAEHKMGSHITPHPPKAQGSLWKRGQKDGRSQRFWKIAAKRYQTR